MKPVHTLTVELWTVIWSSALKGQSHLVSIFIFFQENLRLFKKKSGVHFSLQASLLSLLSYYTSTSITTKRVKMCIDHVIRMNRGICAGPISFHGNTYPKYVFTESRQMGQWSKCIYCGLDLLFPVGMLVSYDQACEPDTITPYSCVT